MRNIASIALLAFAGLMFLNSTEEPTPKATASAGACKCDPTLAARVAELEKQVAAFRSCKCPTPADVSTKPPEPPQAAKQEKSVVVSKAPAGWTCGPNGCSYTGTTTSRRGLFGGGGLFGRRR